jgi:acyl-coenzyme A synthetase/AMP-(fatty) acid ligase
VNTPDKAIKQKLRFSSSDSKPLAFIAGNGISLGKFRDDVEQFASQLPATGDTLISCSGRYAFSIALLASWLRAKTVVLPPNTLDDTLDATRDQFKIGFECGTDWAQELTRTDTSPTHGIWEPQLSQDFPAVKLFTSGSTGSPKTVSKSLSNLLDEARAISTLQNWPSAPVLATVPPQHLYGLTFSVLLPWILENTWIDESPHYPQDLIEILGSTKAKILISVPAQYKTLIHNHTNIDNMLCISAAAALPTPLAQQWLNETGAEILEFYGSTETGVIGYRQQISNQAWKALAQVELSVDGDLLKVNSPFVSYAFTNGFLTADRVVLAKNKLGQFKLLGRSDSIVKIAGNRVSLSKIEDDILSCSGIADAAVIAVPAKGIVRDLSIWVAIVTDNGFSLSSKQLQANLRGKLKGIEMPKRVLIVDHLPRTSNGKLPNTAIVKLFDEHDREPI